MQKYTNIHTNEEGVTFEAHAFEMGGVQCINLNVMVEVEGGYRVLDQIAFGPEDAEAIINLIRNATQA